MLKNVNKFQNVDTCLHLLASKRPTIQAGVPGGIHKQDDNIISIGNLSITLKKKTSIQVIKQIKSPRDASRDQR